MHCCAEYPTIAGSLADENRIESLMALKALSQGLREMGNVEIAMQIFMDTMRSLIVNVVGGKEEERS